MLEPLLGDPDLHGVVLDRDERELERVGSCFGRDGRAVEGAAVRAASM
jgi:hypothetical protein